MSNTASPELAPPTIGSSASAKVTKKRIYIVEDEAVAALDLSEWLEDLGYEVCGIADHCALAVREIAAKQPDLVMMDMHLKGGLDGVDTATEIMRTRRVAVIFLTAYTDPETVRRATEVSPYGYLTKPLQPHGLKPAIEVALRLQEAEQRLRESEHWHAATLRGVADGVIATDAEGQVRFMNPAAERMTRWTLAEAQGQPTWKVMNLQDGNTGKPSRQEGVLRDGHVRMGDVLVTKDGHKCAVDHSQSAIRSDDGTLLGAVAVLRDVTQGRAQDAALQQCEERFRVVFDTAPVGMALVARDGRLLRANAALAELVQRPLAELTHMKEQDISHADDQMLTDVQIAKLSPGTHQKVQFGKRYKTADGTSVSAMVSVSLVPYDLCNLCYLYQVRGL